MAGTEILISLAISAGTSFVASMLAPRQKLLPVDKGRFDDIRIQGSEYGGAVPILYGRARMAGNVIWSDGVQPHVTTTPGTSGGKGGGTPPTPPTNNYSYTTNLAIAICEGGSGTVAQGLKKIWENTKVTVNVDGSLSSGEIYQAESSVNTLTGNATIIRDLSAHSEYKVQLNVGTLKINNILIPTDGTYDIKITYSGLGSKIARIKFDEGSYEEHSFPSTGGTSVYATKTIAHSFTAGLHSMTFAPYAVGLPFPTPSIDYISVQKQGTVNAPRGVTGITDPDAQFPDPENPGQYLPYPPDLNDPTEYYNARLIPDDITGTATGGQFNPNAPEVPDLLRSEIEPITPPGGGTGGTGTGTGTTSSGSTGSSFGAFTFYNGSEAQMPDPMMEAIDGVGNVPAYRGISYITLKNYQIPNGQMPNFSFEIDEGTHDLAEIITSLWKRVGLDESQLNVVDLIGTFVEGLVIQARTPLSDILDILCVAFAFDFVDLDGKVTAIKRGQSSVVTLTENDLRAHEDGGETPVAVIEGSYVNVEELPKQIDVSYIDRAKDYHQNAQPALKQIGYTEEPQTLTLPIVLSANQAQEIGLRVLNTVHMQRATYGFTLPPKFAYLSPTDVVTIVLPSVTYKLRITNFQTGIPGMCKVQAVVDSASLYNNVIAGDAGSGAETPPISFPANTDLTLMDIRPLYPDHTGFGFYASGCPRGLGEWVGAHLYKEDIAVPNSWERISGFEVAATQGVASTTLDADPIYNENGFDTTSTITVLMYYGTLESYTEEEILTNTTLNLCYIGGEVCQFVNAVINNSTVYPFIRGYTLSGFKRGLNGTGDKISGHISGEKFVLFNNAVKFIRQPSAHLYLNANYKAVTIGQPLIGGEIVTFNSGLGSAPPVVTDLSLSQIEGVSPEGVAFVNIRGTFKFGFYVGGQKAKVLIIRPGEGSYTNSGITVFPDANNNGAFEIPTSGNGTYWLKVVSMSPFEHQLSEPPATHPSSSIVIAASNPVPSTPSAPVPSFDGQTLTWHWTQSLDPRHAYYQIADGESITPLPDGTRIDGNSYTEYPTTGVQRKIRSVSNQGTPSLWSAVGTFTIASVPTPTWDTPAYTFDGQMVTWKWIASTANNHSHYKVYDGTTNLVLPTGTRVDSNSFVEYPTHGMQRKIVAVTTQLQQSALSESRTFSVPPPTAPSNYSLQFDGFNLLHTWEGNSAYSFEINDAPAEDVLAYNITGNGFIERNLSYASRTFTRYVRSVQYGQPSAWTGPATLTIPEPDAPEDLFFDTTRATPFAVPLIIVDPLDNFDPRYIRYTVVVIHRTSDNTVLNSYALEGVRNEFVVTGQFADGVNRTIYARVYYVDPFGSSSQSSLSNSYTFPAIGNTNITDPYILGTAIHNGVLNTAAFASGITPVQLYSGSTTLLPALPDTRYPLGAQIYWTNPTDPTHKKLWRNDGGANATAAKATASLSGSAVNSVSVTNGGAGYTTAPTVSFIPIDGNGSGATATANVAGGVVTSINVTSGGTGYTFPPNVVLSGGENVAQVNATVSGGIITELDITNEGSGYTSLPTINVIGGGGSGAVLTPVLSGGTLVDITIDDGGSGYTSAPTIQVSGFSKRTDARDIAANSITAGQIAAGAIRADEIAAGAIRADKIAVGTLTNNLVLNSSFEEFNSSNIPSGWAIIEGSGTFNSVSNTTTASADGSYSLGINASGIGIGCRTFAVIAGETYSIRLKLKTSATSGVYHVRINEYNTVLPTDKFYIGTFTSGEVQTRTSYTDLVNIYNNANETMASVNLTTLGTNTWVQKECVYTVPAGVKYVTFAVYNWTGNNVLYVDAVDIRKQIRGVVIENGSVTAINIAANTITGDLIAGNTITANNLVIGGMSDNLIQNPSFETLGTSTSSTLGTYLNKPIAWMPFGNEGWASITNGVSGSSKAASITVECGISSRAVPVIPGATIAIRAMLRIDPGDVGGEGVSTADQVTIQALFRSTLPTSGTALQKEYVGSSGLGASNYETQLFVTDNNLNTHLLPVPTIFTGYEGTVTVPVGKYWMSIAFQNDEIATLIVDDVVVRQQTGSAFIANLRANQIVANYGDIGLIFSDQIRQTGSVSYQLGSTHTLATSDWTQNGSTISYQETNDLLVYVGTAANWNSAIVSQSFQIIEASSASVKKDGFFEFTYTSKGASSYALGGLIPSTLSVGASNNHTLFQYAWYLSTDGHAYTYENSSAYFDAGTFKEGDVFRVAVENGYVRYRKNEVLMWTSPYTVASTRGSYVYPAFKGGIAFYGADQFVLKSVSLVQSGLGQGWRLNPLVGTSFVSQEPIWTDLVGNYPATPEVGTVFIKNGGSNAWDTSMTSTQTISGGDGWVQASPYQQHFFAFGLSNATNGSFTSPNYTTLQHGLEFESGVVKVYENGTLRFTLTETYSSEDVYRIGIEGGYVKYRKNGAVFYTSSVTTFTYPYRFKVCFYSPGQGIIDPIINATASGAGEFNSGITVKGKSLDETVALATDALRIDRRYRGNDRTYPSTQITSIKHTSYKVDFEDDIVTVTLSMHVNDFKTNPTKHLDSVKHVRVRVFNKFGQRVDDIYGNDLESYIAWHGRGVIFVGTFPRAYADPRQECVYSIEMENLYGMSETLYYCEGTWKSSGGRTWIPLGSGAKANISYTPPQYVSTGHAPTNVKASFLGTTSVRVTWTPTAEDTGSLHAVYYRVFKPQGYAAESGGGWVFASETSDGLLDITGLIQDTRYEFMVQNNESYSDITSNIAYCRTPSIAIPGPTYTAPLNLAGTPDVGEGSNDRTNYLTYIQNSSGGTFVDTRIYYEIGETAVPTTSSSYLTASGGTHSHTGLVDGTWYAYRALNRYNGGANVSELSPTVYIRAYNPGPPATLPTNLRNTSKTKYSITFAWTLNGGSTSTDLELDFAEGTFSPPLLSVTVGSSGTSQVFSGLPADTGFKVRAKHTGSSVWTEPAYGSTLPPTYPTYCIDLYTVMTAVDRYDNEYSLFAKDVTQNMRVIGASLTTGEKVIANVKHVRIGKSQERYTVIADGCSLICSPSHPLINGYGDIHGTPIQNLNIGDPIIMYDDETGRTYVAPIENIIIEKVEIDVIFFTLNSEDHTFVSNRFLSHNRKE